MSLLPNSGNPFALPSGPPAGALNLPPSLTGQAPPPAGLLQQFMAQPAPVARGPFRRLRQNFRDRGGVEGLLGSPAFRVGMGLLSASRDSRIDPYGQVVRGMEQAQMRPMQMRQAQLGLRQQEADIAYRRQQAAAEQRRRERLDQLAGNMPSLLEQAGADPYLVELARINPAEAAMRMPRPTADQLNYEYANRIRREQGLPPLSPEAFGRSMGTPRILNLPGGGVVAVDPATFIGSAPGQQAPPPNAPAAAPAPSAPPAPPASQAPAAPVAGTYPPPAPGPGGALFPDRGGRVDLNSGAPAATTPRPTPGVQQVISPEQQLEGVRKDVETRKQAELAAGSQQRYRNLATAINVRMNALRPVVERVLNSPYLDSIAGVWASKDPTVYLDQPRRDLLSMMERELSGKVLMTARDELKGGGPITDWEARVAGEAALNLERAQSADQIRDNLRRFLGALESAESKYRELAGMPTSGAREGAPTPRQQGRGEQPQLSPEAQDILRRYGED